MAITYDLLRKVIISCYHKLGTITYHTISKVTISVWLFSQKKFFLFSFSFAFSFSFLLVFSFSFFSYFSLLFVFFFFSFFFFLFSLSLFLLQVLKMRRRVEARATHLPKKS